MRGESKLNLRLIFTVSILAIVLLLALGLVIFGYLLATSHAIGHYAPFGGPTNVKTK
jgi:hypothetical protein